MDEYDGNNGLVPRAPVKKVYFMKDGDNNSKPVFMAIKPKDYRAGIEKLEEELTEKVQLPVAARSIFTSHGRHAVRNLEDFTDGGYYVVSSKRRAKGVDLDKVSQSQNKKWHVTGRKAKATETPSYMSNPPPSEPRNAWASPTSTKYSSDRESGYSSSTRDSKPRPKKVYLFRNGNSKICHTMLLNSRTAMSFEQVKQDMNDMFQMRVVKVFSAEGDLVESLSAMLRGTSDKFYIAGNESFKGSTSTPRDSSPEKKKPKYSEDVANRPEEKRDRVSKTTPRPQPELEPTPVPVPARAPAPAPVVKVQTRHKSTQTEAEKPVKKPVLKGGKWQVRVVTAEDDDDDTGIEANVYVTVYGTRGNTDPIPLGINDGDLFQAGNTDEFEISVGKIGDMYKIRLHHDDPRAGWLLDQVWMYDKHTNEELQFSCNRWMSREEDDGEICRELAVSRPGEKTLPLVVYEVTVYTGDLWNAGTQATAFVTLHGERGDTGVREFYKLNGQPNFQKGESDSFNIEAVSLGKLKRCVVGHDGTNAGDGWYLDKVVVKELSKPYREFVFPCMRWLDEGEDDGKTIRDLKIQGEFSTDQVEKARWEYEKWKFMSNNQIMLYSVLTNNPVRIRLDGTADNDGEYKEPNGIFTVTPRKNQIVVLQHTKSKRYYLGIENSKISGQTRGDSYSELRIRVQEDRSLMLESVKYPSQHITCTKRGTMGDPRTHQIDNSKLFFAYCKGMLRDQGTIMFYTSLIQVMNVDGDNGLIATGKKNRLAFFKVHKVGEEGCIRMFESVVHPRHFIRLKETHVDILGNGDKSCEFYVEKVREYGYVTLQSCEKRNLYLGMTEEGHVRPTVESGAANTRFYPEVIEFGNKKEKPKKEEEAKPVVTKPQKHKPKKRKTPTPEPEMTSPTPEPESEPEPEPEEEEEEEVVEEEPQHPEGDWKVWVATEEAGQNGQIVMVAYGDKGNSGQIMLGKCGSKKLFNTGNVDEFKINLKTIGKLYKIRMELIPTDKTYRKVPAIKIKEVKMKDLNSKETLKFKYNAWLSIENDDYDLMREGAAIRPGRNVLPLIKYKVWVHTGKIDSAEPDTEAHIYLCLYGERGDSGKRIISFMDSDQKEKFQEGQVDLFEFDAVHLGKLSHAVVGHDGDGPGEGWFLEKIVVQEGDQKEIQWMFPCKKWLDSGVGDKKLERTLKATEPKEEPPQKKEKPKVVKKEAVKEQKAAPPKEGEWQLVVTTGKDKKHATKNPIYLVVYGMKDGESQQTDPILLDQPINTKAPFMAGANDEFKIFIDPKKVGTLYKLRIGHNNENPKSGWFLDKIKLKSLKTKEQFNLRCGRFLQQGQDDNDTWREFALAAPGAKPLPTIKYKIQVVTGKEPNSEPDSEAHFFLQLFGSRGDSGSRWLYKSLNNDEWFMANQTDEFMIEAVSLDEIKEVKVGHDCEDTGGGWFLSHVIVTEGEGRKARQFIFPCRKWLDGGIDDNQIERIILPGPLPVDEEEPMEEEPEEEPMEEEEEVPPEDPPEPGDWAVWITTGSNEGAETTNPVQLSVYGEDNIFRDIELNKENYVKLKEETDKDVKKKVLFDKGSTDEYKINLKDSGELYKIRIGHMDGDKSSGWYLEKVKMKDLNTEQTYTFKCNRWLFREEDDMDVWREMPVINPGQEPLPVIKYKVEVYTASEPGADTEAELFIQMFGSHGDSGKRVLLNCQNNKNPFQEGQMDVFEVEAVELQEIEKVVMGHEEKGKGAGWKCEKVIIKEGDAPDAKMFYFPCDKWFDSSAEDKKIVRELLPGEPPKDSRGEYKVWIKTSDDSKDAKNSAMTLTVYGEKGKTKDIELHEDGAFAAGKTDEFDNITLGDLGDIYKIRVGRKDKDEWEGWHLDEVKLQDKDTEKEYVFVFDRWMDRQQDDHDIVRELAAEVDGKPCLPMQHYEISVYTGDHWAAGTDANVYLTMFGSKGDSGKRWLYHSDSNPDKFQRNQVDKFVLEAVTLEDLERIVIGHDGEGYGAGWFLDRLVIKQMDGDDTSNVYVFSCNRWLDDHEDDFKTERELRLLDVVDGSKEPAEVNETKTVGAWTVKVKTSDMHNASSKAQLYITVYGTEGVSDVQPLGEAGGDDFEQGKESEFNINVGDIGSVTKIRLHHDNSNDFPSLHLDKVVMNDKHTNEELIFYCDRWLATDEADCMLIREFTPMRPSQPSAPVLRYNVAVFTSNIAKAGTTANATIILYGKNGDTGRRPLAESKTSDKPFKKGQVDVFTVEAAHLGDLMKVDLEHDGTEPESAWHVEKVVVKETNHALTETVFKFNCWLEPAESEDNPSVMSRQSPVQEAASELPPLKDAPPETESQGRWTLWVSNGTVEEEEEEEQYDQVEEDEEEKEKKEKEKAEALKNTEISMIVFGTKGTTEPIDLWAPNDSWENKEKEDKEEETPESTPRGKGGKDKGSKDRKDSKGKKEPEKPGKGGKKGKKGEKEPEEEPEKKEDEEPKEKPDRFKPEIVDEHKVSFGDIGQIYKVRLIVDGKSATSAINLLKLKLKDEDSKQEFHFVNVEIWSLGQTIRATPQTPQSVLELPAIRPDLPPTPEVTYNLSITTGDAERAETEAEMYCILHGTKGDTGVRKLTESNKEKPFRRNQTDKFEVTLLDIGRVEKVTLGHHQHGRGHGWLCDHVVVRSGEDLTETVFPCHRWIDSGTEDRKLEIELVPLADIQVPPEPEEEEDKEDKIETKGNWQCTIKMAESLPDPPPPEDDKENADPNAKEPKKGKDKNDKSKKDDDKSKKDKDAKGKDNDAKGKDKDSKGKDGKSKGKEKEDNQEEGGEGEEENEEKRDEEAIEEKSSVSLTVYCEKGVAGPFTMEVNEEHEFLLGGTEVFDDLVSVEELGAIVKIRVKDSMTQHHRMWSIQEITLKDVDTKEVLTFNFTVNVGQNLITEDKIDYNNREFENKLDSKDCEIESYALRHEKPVLPLVEYQITVYTKEDKKEEKKVDTDEKNKDKEAEDSKDDKKGKKDKKDKKEEPPSKKDKKDSKDKKGKKGAAPEPEPEEPEEEPRPLDVFPVHIQVFGQRNGMETDSGVKPLLYNKDSTASFQPGQVDVFTISAIDLGDLTRVKLDKGPSKLPWSLSKVTIRKGPLGPTEEVFLCEKDLVLCHEDTIELAHSGFELCEVAVPSDEAPPEIPKSTGKWKIWSTTGIEENEDPRYALPKCLQLTICGLKEDSQPILLQPHSEYAFQIGEIDQFQFEQTEDIGDIFKIRIGIVEPPKEEKEGEEDAEEKGKGKDKKDDKKKKDKKKEEEKPKEEKPKEEDDDDNKPKFYSWYLDEIKLEDQDSGDVFTCMVDDWIKLDDVYDGIKELAVCWPKNKVLPVCKYQIETHTGDCDNAETQATPYVTLFGQTGNSGKRRLLASSNTEPQEMFKRGQMDKFEVEAVQLYSLNKVVVGHDLTDPGAGWFLQKVVVKEAEKPDKEYIFDCNRWLDSEQDDLAIERVLMLAEPPKTKWKVRLTTGVPPPNPPAEDAAKPEEAEAEGEKKDEEDNKDKKNDKDKKNKDKKDDKDKSKADKKDKKDKNKDEKEDEEEKKEEPEPKESGRPAGPLVIAVYGDKGKSQDIVIEGVEDEHLKPENTDEYEIDIPEELGEIYKVRIGSVDGEDFEWYLEKVCLQRVGEEKEHIFMLNNWVRKSEVADGWKEIPIQPEQPPEEEKDEEKKEEEKKEEEEKKKAEEQKKEDEKKAKKDDKKKKGKKDESKEDKEEDKEKEEEKKNDEENKDEEKPPAVPTLPVYQYQVTLYTGDKPGSVLDSSVYLTVNGERGDTGKRMLKKIKKDSPEEEADEKSDANKVEVFEVEAVDLLDLKSLLIGHTGSGENNGWFLEKIVIKPCAEDETEFIFECSKWLDEGEDDGLLERNFDLTRKEPEEKEWQVAVTTGDEEASGTQAQVYLTVFGEDGDTGPLELGQAGGEDFAQGTTGAELKVKFFPKKVGKFTKIRLFVDNYVAGEGWFCEKVVLTNPDDPTDQSEFSVNRWLDVGQEDGDVVREVAAKQPEEEPVPSTKYSIDVVNKTSFAEAENIQVHVTLHGEKGDSSKRVLIKPTEDKEKLFQEGTDTFSVEAVGLGDLNKLTLGHNIEDKASSWTVEKVVVKETTEGQEPKEYVFPCDQPLDCEEGDKLVERELELEGAKDENKDEEEPKEPDDKDNTAES